MPVIRWKKHFIWILLGVILSLTLSACSVGNPTTDQTEMPDGVYKVDPTFAQFYRVLGGKETLGYPISPVINYNDMSIQYTENAAMIYDPNQNVSNQFSLAPLGVELGIKDTFYLPEQSGSRIVDGFLIYDEFTSLYDKFQGARFAGRPLTQVRKNVEKNRIEQYFANVAFYRSLDDPSGKVHLLAYGSWKCDRACRFPPPQSAQVSTVPYYPEPFLKRVSRLGSDLVGDPISSPHIASDGMLEQIYENVAVYADPKDINTIHLRPLPEILGYAETGLVPRVDDPRMVFRSIHDDLGHNIPLQFNDFIALHGGMEEISGLPITELFQEGSVYRQCYVNYCLDYDPAVDQSVRIRPAALGRQYYEEHSPVQSANEGLSPSPDSLTMNIWENKPMISSIEEQHIGLQVLEKESQVPVQNIEASLLVGLPDGTILTYHFPPTDSNGQATVAVPAVIANNGTTIPYQVCLNVGNQVCKGDSYVIWGNP